MLYRQARFEEIPILYKIRKKQLIDEGIAPDVNIDEALIGFFERYMSDGTLVEWVAEEHGKIIATAALYFQEFPPTFTNPNGINIKGYVTNMYTAPEYRGRGIARKLLDCLVIEAKEHHVLKMWLGASKMGRPVYLDYGFQESDVWLDMDV